MKSIVEINDVDRRIYEEKLQHFLPEKIIDIHTHVWLDRLKKNVKRDRVVTWPSLVAKENPIEDHLECYKLLFPGKQVTPMIFSSLVNAESADGLNDYVSQCAKEHELPALLFSVPEWSAEEVERKVVRGGFLGIKVYLNLAPAYLPRQEIRIFDFLPPHQLELMHEKRRIVMLHIPRDARLRDPVNLAQIREIERKYPGVRVILAHVGRAYCNEDVGDAFEVLKETERLVVDFSANTNAWVFEGLIRALGPRRVLFGSDLPILRMRMRRICENGVYINLVPKGLYGDVSGDPNMREVSGDEAARLTLFMYEELLAFRRAAEKTGLSRDDLEDVFYKNSAALIKAVREGR
ncbi:MAG: amidohydrolase family protein [Spirochaetaceae bacterium]|nr:MAG: amidohydrolase family protein [Spirochaetaceae bacterium]